MANEKEAPLLKLTPEARKRLVDLESDIRKAEIALQQMELLDMDVSVLRADLEKHKRVRTTLLKEF